MEKLCNREGGGWYVTWHDLPVQSQENMPNLPLAHLYHAEGGGGLLDFSVFHSFSWWSIDAAGWHPNNQHGKDLLPLWRINWPYRSYMPKKFRFFIYLQGFVIVRQNLRRNAWRYNDCQDTDWEIHIVRTQLYETLFWASGHDPDMIPDHLLW